MHDTTIDDRAERAGLWWIQNPSFPINEDEIAAFIEEHESEGVNCEG